MSEREEGIRQVRAMIPASVWDADDGARESAFAPELAELTLVNVYGRLWAREGLDRRSRSLLTLGMLITLRAGDELEVHFKVALQNGLTREELEEVIYHATGYAGFPAAAAAAKHAAVALGRPEEP